MEGIKLEAGKYYRTRDGRKFFAVGRTDNGRFVIQAEGINDGFYTVMGDGRRMGFDRVSDLDLVAEWKEPKRIKGFVRLSSPHGSDVIYASFHQTKPEGCGSKETLLAIEEIDVLEGQGLDGSAR